MLSVKQEALVLNDPTAERAIQDPTAEGLKARIHHLGREACPYPLDSDERHEWLEGYDGVHAEGSPLISEMRADATGAKNS